MVADVGKLMGSLTSAIAPSLIYSKLISSSCMRFLVQGYRRLLMHPKYGIWVVLASLLYLISPIDLSPDLLPLLGQIDDVALILLMLTAVSQWLSQQFTAGETLDASARATQEDDSIRETVDVSAVEVDAAEG